MIYKNRTFKTYSSTQGTVHTTHTSKTAAKQPQNSPITNNLYVIVITHSNRLDGITGVQDKALYLSSFTPEDRTRWVSRIMLYIQVRMLTLSTINSMKRTTSCGGCCYTYIYKKSLEYCCCLRYSDNYYVHSYELNIFTLLLLTV